jgi:acetyl-CoA synthetase
LRDRILDADCRTVITADEGVRGGKFVPLKQNVDKALPVARRQHRGGGRTHQGKVDWVEAATSGITRRA